METTQLPDFAFKFYFVYFFYIVCLINMFNNLLFWSACFVFFCQIIFIIFYENRFIFFVTYSGSHKEDGERSEYSSRICCQIVVYCPFEGSVVRSTEAGPACGAHRRTDSRRQEQVYGPGNCQYKSFRFLCKLMAP